MTPEQLEGTKLILEFMGFVVKDFGAAGLRYTVPECKDENYYDWLNVKNCLYHSSWDWLMEACKKFDNMKVEYSIFWEFQDMKNDVATSVMTYDIDTVFSNLVRAIKWYNQNC